MDEAPPPIALSIAGSDSGCGAGIQMDLQILVSLGVYPLTVLTAVTAQNTLSVDSIHAVDPQSVKQQIETVCKDFHICAAKTGMLYSCDVVDVVAAMLVANHIPFILDPVLSSTSGDKLHEGGLIDALCDKLCPQASLITPNAEEAACLVKACLPRSPQKKSRTLSGTGARQDAARSLQDDAERMAGHFGVPILITGGDHESSMDILVWEGGVEKIPFTRQYPGEKIHGTGCALSSAIAAHRALGYDLLSSVYKSHDFVQKLIRNSYSLGSGSRVLIPNKNAEV